MSLYLLEKPAMSPITVHEATSRYDDGVRALFRAAHVPIDGAFWARAFSPDNPGGTASQPLVAVDEETGAVEGFLCARPIKLHFEGEFVDAQVLHDFVLRSGPADLGSAGHAMIREALTRAEMTIVAGAGTALTPVLEAEGFLLAGFFSRMRFDPVDGDSARPDMTLPFVFSRADDFPPALEKLNQAHLTEKRIFRMRDFSQRTWLFAGPAPEFEILIAAEDSPIDAYVVLRTVTGRFGPELHVVDFACPIHAAKRLSLALRELAHERQQTLYVSFFGRAWNDVFMSAGFQLLRARWALQFQMRDPRQRAISGALMRSESWFFTPADGEIDHW